MNLSTSAGTSDPVIVVDSSGRAHAIWKDAIGSFVHATFENGTWSVAQPLELPFGTRRYYPDLLEHQATPLHTPVLWAGGDDRVHAMWMNLDGRLLYSNVPSSDFAEFAAWTFPQELASSALAATATADESGRLHVAYARPTATTQSPSGLYYRVSSDSGATWSDAVMLYESPYFRSMAPEQSNIQLASTVDGLIVAAWDNPFQERVYIVRSGDAGQSWDPPVEIDRRVRADGTEAAGPNSIRVEASGDAIHLVWQAGHEGFLCAPYHQMSDDGGLTWQTPERLSSGDESCSDFIALVAGEGDELLLMTATENEGAIAAWDGAHWGATQSREELIRFINPLNFREVVLGCQQVVTGVSGELGSRDSAIVLGCDTGAGGDVWAMSVELGPLVEEIAPQVTPIWQNPEVLSQPLGSESLQLLADADGWLHAMWVQPIADEDMQTAVYYSRWDGTSWSQPQDLLRSPEGQVAVQPAIALGADDKIMAVWLDGVPGSVYFSQADLARAGNASEWSSAIRLPMEYAGASAPEIAVGQDGVVYVTYAVPLNEGRGVYLTRSIDGGESWSDPQQVFDSVSAGWAMVDDPHISVGDEGRIHMLWTRFAAPPNSAPLSLHYSRSDDGGDSWQQFTEVTSSPGAWSDLQASSNLAVHRFWLAENDDLWHQFSGDGGTNWEQPQRVSSSGDTLAMATSVLDGAGRPWLLQVAGTRTVGNEIHPPFALRSWVLSDGRWTTAEELKLNGSEIEEFAAATAAGGNLNVIFSAIAGDLGAEQIGQTIYHSGRSLDLPEIRPTSLPTLTPTPLPEATPTPTLAPLPTATTSFPTDAGDSGGLPIPIDTSNPITGPLLGIIPAAAMVLIALFIGVRLLRGDRHR